MEDLLKKILSKTADTIRQLSMEAVQKADSGHPGLPMGCAEIGAYLYGEFLRYNPKDPQWLGRDRFVLSAGHGSMLLYSLLHLSGYDLSLDEIKRFRQWHSKTPGHPEFGETPGVESTTGPLGQGVGNAIGQALGLKILAEKFNRPGFDLFTSKVVCLAGDGCIMEGVSQEACSLAGHLKINNFILIHDANHVTLDGPLSQSCSENTLERMRAYGFDAYEVNGNDIDELAELFSNLRASPQQKPIYISARTIIGKGSPNKAGTYKVHGSPLGKDEVELTKKALGLPEEDFFIPQAVKTYFKEREERGKKLHTSWNQVFAKYRETFPDLAVEFDQMLMKKWPEDLEKRIQALPVEGAIAMRNASQEILTELGSILPYLYGGSADLSGSDCTMMKQFSLIAPGDFSGRNIKYGIREFGMATIAAGLWQSQMILPYIGTFLTFSDYMRNAIRLACLSHYQVIYQFTHDSIFLGEDGPTHQPIEHLAALRAIPNLHVIRPADANEVKAGWIAALRYKGPTAFILTRQKLPLLSQTKSSYEEGVGKGGYIVHKEKGSQLDFTLIATGSEVSLALEVADTLEKIGKHVRVVSLPCWELFQKQGVHYQKAVLGEKGRRVSIEAATSFGWAQWIGLDGIAISIDTFGASAPMGDLKEHFGFTVEAIVARLLS